MIGDRAFCQVQTGLLKGGPRSCRARWYEDGMYCKSGVSTMGDTVATYVYELVPKEGYQCGNRVGAGLIVKPFHGTDQSGVGTRKVPTLVRRVTKEAQSVWPVPISLEQGLGPTGQGLDLVRDTGLGS